MPADVTVALARKRQARSEMQNDVTVLLVWLVASLGVITLLFASNELAEAMALMGSY
jgi:hypothetical protein